VSFARQAGVRAAKNELVVFCDDDNWLAPDYLDVANTIMSSRPDIGALGGQSIPHFEDKPPSWVSRNQESFALGPQADTECDVTERRGWLWGAGMVVRTAALREVSLAEVEFVTVDRGEVVELCLYLRELGWRIWYSPRLKLTHFMPASRFDQRKFQALTIQNGVLFATVQYPIHQDRGRMGATLSSIKAYAWTALRHPRSFRAAWETFYHFGKLVGFATEAERFAIVRENRRKLQKFRLAAPRSA
jgi:GT2 family glycosyltransferase